MSSIQALSKRTLLVILDGFGISENHQKNAIKDATTPHLDHLFSHYPYTLIEAGGTSVGLPKGVAGNSEVGHMNLGAGKPVRQDLVRINESIAQKTYSDLPLIKELIQKAKDGSKRIHLMGLLSDGGVHSHIDHLKATVDILSSCHNLQIYFHAFMDGRDTAKNAGEKYIKELQNIESHQTNFHLASMQGRSIGMDRDRRWEKIKHCYDTFIGKGKITSCPPLSYLELEYKKGIFDEFITPVLFNREYAMGGDDVVFFLNFRPDRAIQITLAMNDLKFEEYERPWIPPYFLCMTPYTPDEVQLPILFDKEAISGGLSEYLSQQGHAQFKIAETEKYAHITFFFNGGRKKPFPKEKHILIPSPKDVETYDQRPEMSASQVTEQLQKALEDSSYKFYLVNYANSDMVGHTGNYQAAIKAIETLDDCVGKLKQKVEEQEITMILTADHGNSDQMVYPDGSPHTSHTGAPVPFCVFHPSLENNPGQITRGQHALKDVAPTILTTLGLPIPDTFEGHSIFK